MEVCTVLEFRKMFVPCKSKVLYELNFGINSNIRLKYINKQFEYISLNRYVLIIVNEEWISNEILSGPMEPYRALCNTKIAFSQANVHHASQLRGHTFS